jgi:hypothetical protein
MRHCSIEYQSIKQHRDNTGSTMVVTETTRRWRSPGFDNSNQQQLTVTDARMVFASIEM